jgi:hypothetical protein
MVKKLIPIIQNTKRSVLCKQSNKFIDYNLYIYFKQTYITLIKKYISSNDS